MPVINATQEQERACREVEESLSFIRSANPILDPGFTGSLSITIPGIKKPIEISDDVTVKKIILAVRTRKEKLAKDAYVKADKYLLTLSDEERAVLGHPENTPHPTVMAENQHYI